MITNISLPQTEEIGLETITTAKISTSFHRSPVTFRQGFTGDTKIWNSFSMEKTEVPVTQKSYWENQGIWRSKFFQSDLLHEWVSSSSSSSRLLIESYVSLSHIE